MPRRSGVIGTPALKTEAVRTFAAAQRGDVLQAGHPGYDDARALFNAMIDRRPALIVRCEENADVQRALGLRMPIACSSRCGAAATTWRARPCATTGW